MNGIQAGEQRMKHLCQRSGTFFCSIITMIGWLFLVGVFLSLAGCGQEKKGKELSKQMVRARALILVKHKVLLSRSFAGQIQAKRHVVLSSKLGGYVTSFGVQEGDFVRSGQTLLTLDDRELQDKIRSVDSQIEQVLRQKSGVEARLFYARANFERFSRLYAKQSVTKDEFERVRAEYQFFQAQEESLQAQTDSLQAKRGELESLLSYARIRAPVSGWVVRKFVDIGSFAVAGRPLLAIDNHDRGFWFVAYLDESILSKVEKGQQVNVVIPALSFQGRALLAALVPRVDPVTRTFKIKVDLHKLSGARSGMYGRVYLALGKRSTLLIPSPALLRLGQLTGVFVADGQGVLHWRVISLGDWFVRQAGSQGAFMPVPVDMTGDMGKMGAEIWVEVLSGLNPGERIVVSNLHKITEGMVLQAY